MAIQDQPQEQVTKDPHDTDPHRVKLKITAADHEKRKRTKGMPDFLFSMGDGSLTPEAPEELEEQAQPAVENPEDRQPEPTAGSNAGGPTGGETQQGGGGAKPTLAQELAGSVAMQPGQRGPEDKKEETGSAAVAKAIAPQLLSAPEFLNRQRIDERKLAVLNDLTQTSLNYLAFRGYVDKIRFWAWFVDSELVTSQAIGGLARRHALRAIEASSGASITEVEKKPNVMARNLWNRSWKKEAIAEGKEVEE